MSSSEKLKGAAGDDISQQEQHSGFHGDRKNTILEEKIVEDLYEKNPISKQIVNDAFDLAHWGERLNKRSVNEELFANKRIRGDGGGESTLVDDSDDSNDDEDPNDDEDSDDNEYSYDEAEILIRSHKEEINRLVEENHALSTKLQNSQLKANTAEDEVKQLKEEKEELIKRFNEKEAAQKLELEKQKIFHQSEIQKFKEEAKSMLACIRKETVENKNLKLHLETATRIIKDQESAFHAISNIAGGCGENIYQSLNNN